MEDAYGERKRPPVLRSFLYHASLFLNLSVLQKFLNIDQVRGGDLNA